MELDVGKIVNGLGVAPKDLDDDCLISDAVVLLKCVQPDGEVTLWIGHSHGMSWIERLGMLRAAERIEGPSGWHTDT